MSELLEEARERRDRAELSTESPSYNWLNDSYYLGEQTAWQEAVELIEKHEKPKGLIDLVDPMWKGMATVARQKQCKYCHEPHNYIFIYEENEPNPDMTNGYINHEGILCIQFSSYVFVNLNINYCPVCGRDLNEVEE